MRALIVILFALVVAGCGKNSGKAPAKQGEVGEVVDRVINPDGPIVGPEDLRSCKGRRVLFGDQMWSGDDKAHTIVVPLCYPDRMVEVPLSAADYAKFKAGETAPIMLAELHVDVSADGKTISRAKFIRFYGEANKGLEDLATQFQDNEKNGKNQPVKGF